MSGAPNRPGQSSWQWSESMQDYYRYDAGNQQYILYYSGRTVPAADIQGRTPRNQQQTSRSDIRASSRPDVAGSPPDRRASYSLQGGQRAGIQNTSQGHPTQVARSGQQGAAHSASSTQSLSPPTGPFTGSSTSQYGAGIPSQNPSQRTRGDHYGSMPQRSARAEVNRPAPNTSSETPSAYSPQARPFMPSSSLYGGSRPVAIPGAASTSLRSPPASLNEAMDGLSIRAGQLPEPPSSYHSASGSGRPQSFVDEAGVRSIIYSGNVPTDPSLRQEGITAHKYLMGTEEEAELLYPTFQKRPKPNKFFTIGKVFMILWAEPAGDSGKSNTLITSKEPSMIPGKFGQMVFSKVRRFIVIRESERYCSALSIVSYGDQGAAKSGTVKSEHGIVYIGREEPRPFPDELPQRGEGGMVPTAIRIDPDQKIEKLTSRSRINYGKVYTVEHNVKVRSIGTVSRDSLQPLIYQFRNVWNSGITHRRGLSVVPEQHASGSQQGASSSRQGSYAAALEYLMSQGWTREQAENMLKGQGKKNKGREEDASESENEGQDDANDNDDDDDDDDDLNASTNVRMEKAIRKMQKYGGFTREGAIAAIRREQRKSFQAKTQAQNEAEDDESEEESSSSSDEKAKAAKNTQIAAQRAAQTQRFNEAVAALRQRGVSHEDAVRSVQLSFRRAQSQATTNASQSWSAGRRRVRRDNDSRNESAGRSSDDDR